MPRLSFRLTELKTRFEVSRREESWHYCLVGTCIRNPGDSFTIKREKMRFDGFSATVVATLRERLPLKDQHVKVDDRDYIRVYVPDSQDEQPDIHIRMSLPPDAFQRVLATDWTKQDAILSVASVLSDQYLKYGDDPDGREVVWQAEKPPKAVDLDEVSLYFCLKTSDRENDEDDDEKPAPPLEQVLTAIRSTTAAIESLRNSLITVLWVIAGLVIVAALIT